MNSVEEVYKKLRKYDKNNQLIYDKIHNIITLKIEDKAIVEAMDDYIGITIIKGYNTHFHPDYNEMYLYLLKVIEKRENVMIIKDFSGKYIENLVYFCNLILLACYICSFFNMKGSVFLSTVLFIFIIGILIWLTLLMKNFISCFRIRNIDKKDIELIKKFTKKSYPYYMHELDLYLIFDYIRMTSNDFLKYPQKIKMDYPLVFSKEEITRIENTICDKNSNTEANELREYYLMALEVIEIINKYYDKSGVKKQTDKKNHNNIALIIIVLGLMIFNYIFLWFTKELFALTWLTLGLPLLAVMFVNFFVFMHLLTLIRKDKKRFVNWLPLLIFVVMAFLFTIFPPTEIREFYEYKKYYDKRIEIVNMIKDGSFTVSEHKKILLPNNYKKIAEYGEVYVYLNNGQETLISFWIDSPFPDNGTELIYSSGGIALIKENINSIRKIEKRNDNWYFVRHD